MKNTLKISLKPNEKIYLNGAVITVDRKVTIELLNDVQFLLESHVLQIDDASTPLRQLYFILQVMLMNPTGANDAYEMFRRSLPLMIASFSDPEISGTLKQIDRMVGEGHVYEALKAIRGLYPLESKALGENDDAPAGQSQSGQSQSGQRQAGQRQAGQTRPEQLRAEPSRARAGAAS
jgi:flagellar protein FlbT